MGDTTLRYLTELLNLRCAPELMRLKLFPDAKEVTESLAMVNAARCFLALGQGNAGSGAGAAAAAAASGGEPPREDIILVVGDGATPRTAALFAFMTKGWTCVSVDPLMEAAAQRAGGKYDGSAEASEEYGTFHHPWESVEGLRVVPRCMEQAVIRARRLVIVLMHAHIPLDVVSQCIDCVACEGVIACPCCNWAPAQALWRGMAPNFVYEDPAMLSDRREVRVWAPPGGPVRIAGLSMSVCAPAGATSHPSRAAQGTAEYEQRRPADADSSSSARAWRSAQMQSLPHEWGPYVHIEAEATRAAAGSRSVGMAVMAAQAAQQAANEAEMQVRALKRSAKEKGAGKKRAKEARKKAAGQQEQGGGEQQHRHHQHRQQEAGIQASGADDVVGDAAGGVDVAVGQGASAGPQQQGDPSCGGTESTQHLRPPRDGSAAGVGAGASEGAVGAVHQGVQGDEPNRAEEEIAEAGRVLKERSILVRQERERLRVALVEQSLRDRTEAARARAVALGVDDADALDVEDASAVLQFVTTYTANAPVFEAKLEDTVALESLPSVRVKGRVTSVRVRNRFLAFLTLTDIVEAADGADERNERTLAAEAALAPSCQVLLSASHLKYPDAAPFTAVSSAIKTGDVIICAGAVGRTKRGGLTLFCGRVEFVSVPMPDPLYMPQTRIG